jgi:small GTP-binding protein
LIEMARKACICGDPGVGKTSLVRRFVLQRYDEKYISTLGTVVSKKAIRLPELGCNLNLMIWDISGQAEFKRIHATAFSNSAGGFVVYDANRPETKESVKDWVATMKKWAGESVPITILANKTDLLPKSERPQAGEMMGYPCVPTSAKEGENVDEAFRGLGELIAKAKEGPSMPAPGKAPAGELPENFENSGELLDFIAISLCNSLKDQEMGMHILRKQVTSQGIDFTHMRRADAEKLVDKLGDVVRDFKDPRDVSDIKIKMHRAIERTKW